MITGSAPSANTDLEAIFAGQGLVPERWSFLMEADLDDDEVGTDDPPVPDGYVLSTWEGIDHEEMRTAHNVAFVGHYGFTPWSPEMWAQWVSETRNFRPELSLVLRDEAGAVASYVQTAEFDATQEATGLRDAFVAKLGTPPQHRRKGLASLLLRIALHRYREAGFDKSDPRRGLGEPDGSAGHLREGRVQDDDAVDELPARALTSGSTALHPAAVGRGPRTQCAAQLLGTLPHRAQPDAARPVRRLSRRRRSRRHGGPRRGPPVAP